MSSTITYICISAVHLSSNNAKHQNTGAKTLHSALRAQNMKHNQCSKKETVKQKIIVDVDAYQVNEASTLDEDWWIEELNLLHTEKEIIVSGKWLSEPIITAGQVILAKQFKHVWNGAGFQEVGCSFTMSFNIETCKFIQILHDPAGHWLTISNVETESPNIINVYDSMNSLCSSNVQQQIACLLNTFKSHIFLNFVDVHLQDGGSDCGLLSLAYATALCYNKNPGSYMFDQSSLRHHLVQCLEKQNFSMFPVKSERRKWS